MYKKFLKNWDEKNELEYKDYKHLFEAVKKCSKKPHFSKLILRYKNNIKKNMGSDQRMHREEKIVMKIFQKTSNK